jgi:hypothetical protein
MKIVNSVSGKVTTCVIGPKHYLHENIRLGEVAICIARDERQSSKKMVWLIGGIEQLIDYISLARSQGDLSDGDATSLLTQLDIAKKKIPVSAEERLASALGMEVDELRPLLEVAQVSVSAPIMGVNDYSTNKPKWMPKTLSHAPIH